MEKQTRRILLQPPHISRLGTKYTLFTNIKEMSLEVNISMEDIQKYLNDKLNTTSILIKINTTQSDNLVLLNDDIYNLKIKGRFQQKIIEILLRELFLSKRI